MRKPDENLDDFVVKPAPEISLRPPRPVSLRCTGKVEVLKPVAVAQGGAKRARKPFRGFQPLQPLWFRRFVAVGSGALVFVALVLVSAILVSITDQTAGPTVATSSTTGDVVTQPDELFSFDLSVPLTFVESVQSSKRQRPVRHVITKTKPQLRAPLQPEEPTFVPTTLVIYAQNGVINTRIEPWLQGGYKKLPTSNN